MPRASGPTPVPLTIGPCLVIKHEEVIGVPAIGVITDNGRLTLLIEFFYLHEEDALIDGLSCGSSLFAQFRGPQTAIIVVITGVALKSPWISHFDEPGAGRKLDCPKYDIGMGSLKLALIQEGSRDSFRVEKHHFVVDVMLVNLVPERVNCQL